MFSEKEKKETGGRKGAGEFPTKRCILTDGGIMGKSKTAFRIVFQKEFFSMQYQKRKGGARLYRAGLSCTGCRNDRMQRHRRHYIESAGRTTAAQAAEETRQNHIGAHRGIYTLAGDCTGGCCHFGHCSHCGGAHLGRGCFRRRTGGRYRLDGGGVVHTGTADLGERRIHLFYLSGIQRYGFHL